MYGKGSVPVVLAATGGTAAAAALPQTGMSAATHVALAAAAALVTWAVVYVLQAKFGKR